MRLSQIFFLATVFFIPVQLSKFFWTDSSFVLGIPIDYLALSVYFTDLPILLFIFTFLWENKKQIPYLLSKNKYTILILGIFYIYLIFNSLLRQNPQVSLFLTFKIIQFSLFGYFASYALSENKIKNPFYLAVLISIVWQSVLVFLQLIFQKSTGLFILGERAFDTTTTSIAHANVFGRQILRPYGTFPHPNVTAAFFVIYLFLANNKKMIFIITLVSTIMTFSKSALIALISYFVVNEKSVVKKILLLIISITITVLALRSLNISQMASISERIVLLNTSIDITRTNPAFGVGNGNFIKMLAKLNIENSHIRLLQPVHNIFFLILAEIGIIGLLFFFLFLFSIVKKINNTHKIAIFLILMIFASLDHFFWTLNQGRALFWLSIAYLMSDSKNT